MQHKIIQNICRLIQKKIRDKTKADENQIQNLLVNANNAENVNKTQKYRNKMLENEKKLKKNIKFKLFQKMQLKKSRKIQNNAENWEKNNAEK